MNNAIETWAVKYADLYKKHGMSEGPPETWCNDCMLDDAIENEAIMAALFEILKAEFLKAVK